MKTRENKAMRFASVLLVLTLLATSLTAGTFAKYATSDEGEAKARVAKFGVDVSVDASKVFGKQYGADDAIVEDDANGITVQAESSATEKNVVAPGTSGSMTFTIEGNPETSVKLGVKFEGIKEVMLAAGTYTNGVDGKAVNVEANGYYPVKWTLKKGNNIVNNNGTTYVDTTLEAIETYLEGDTFSKVYDPNALSTVKGTYTLSWKWDFDTTNPSGTNDDKDTILGDLAAGVTDIEFTKATSKAEPTKDTDYVLDEAFTFSISVTQED